MSEARRSEYLQAIGIDTWRLRSNAAPPEDVPEHPTETVPAIPEQAAPKQVGRPPDRARVVAPLGPAQPGAAADESGLDWEELRARVAICTRCSLSETRTQTVFGVGNRNAEWLIIGEAPGAEEDRRGEPFVGRAGQLLNSMLLSLGLQREQVYIANVIKCRPPGNRDPRPEEVRSCSSYLQRQIALLSPKILLVVGRIAAQNLLGSDLTLGRLRQQVHSYGLTKLPLIVTYHPAYLLRSPAEKRKAWDDLKFAKTVLERGRS